MSDSNNLEAHLFVCTNQRESGESCGQKGGAELRDQLKAMCKEKSRGWKGRVRVNAAGCLGRCEEGIVAVLYPQSKWFTRLDKKSEFVVMKALSDVLDRK